MSILSLISEYASASLIPLKNFSILMSSNQEYNTLLQPEEFKYHF